MTSPARYFLDRMRVLPHPSRLLLGAAFLFATAFPSLYAGGARERESSGSGGAPDPRLKNQRVLSVYVVDDTPQGDRGAGKAWVEGMYLPQGAASYFPTQFTVSEGRSRLSFDASLPYRVLSKEDLGARVRRYSIEMSVAAAPLPGSGKFYSFTFPRSALGGEGRVALQPAPYALERGIKLSNRSGGVVQLGAFRYDADAELFKAVVYVGP